MSAAKPSSNQRGLIPTIGCAVGMLVGGLIGPIFGASIGSETLTMVGYVVGAIVGAVGGSAVGFQWQSRRRQRLRASQSEEPCSPLSTK